MGGGRAAPCLVWQWAEKDGCAQRTGAHARPKHTSYLIKKWELQKEHRSEIIPYNIPEETKERKSKR